MLNNLNQTTISGALLTGAKSLVYVGGTTPTVGMIAVCDREIFLITGVDSVNKRCTIQKGYAGTQDGPHGDASVIWIDSPANFYLEWPEGQATIGNETIQPRILLPGPHTTVVRAFRILNSLWVEVPTERQANVEVEDRATGYVYLLVKCSDASAAVGDWWNIDQAGVAIAQTTGTKGRVGICTEVIAAANTYTWALIKGAGTAKHTSDVTTGCVLIAGTGTVNISTSTGGNVVFNASIIAVGTSATDLGTAYIDRPWTYGLTTDIVP